MFGRVAHAFLASALLLASVPARCQNGPVYEGRSSLAPASRVAWLERVERAKTRYQAFAARARLALHPPVIEPGVAPARPAGAATGLFDDPTLRPGDVVVTSEGLMVFRGASRLPHARGDFEPIATAKTRHGPELIELQRALTLGKR